MAGEKEPPVGEKAARDREEERGAKAGTREERTLYDRLVEKAKNHPLGVAALLAVAVVGFLGGPEKLSNWFAEKEDPAPQVRVQYYSLGGHAISLLLVGRLDAHFAKLVGGKPVVWQNMVYEELRTLHNQFARPLDADYVLHTADEELVKNSASLAFIPATTYRELDARFISFDPGMHDFLRNPLDGNGWKLAFAKDRPKSELAAQLKSGSLDANSLLFSKRLNCAQGLALLDATEIGQFFRHIGRAGCEDLSFDLVAKYIDLGCGGAGWDFSLRLPRVELRVAVIQNIAGKAIKLNRVILSRSQANGIEALAPAAGDKQVQGTIGDGTLLPEDRLVIPLGVSFNHTPAGREGSNQLEVYSPSEMRELLSGNAGPDRLQLMAFVEPSASPNAAEKSPQSVEPVRQAIGAIGKSGIVERYGFTPRDESQTQPSFGTSLRPIKIVVNGVQSNVHTVNLGGMYVSDYFQGGSCPYVYMRENGQARALGEILVGRDTAAKHGTSLKRLPAWPSEILLSEEEAETSYIAYALAICETGTGEQHVRHPANANEVFAAGPRVLRKGESLSLYFAPLASQIRCESAFLEVKGHYIADTPTPAKNLFARWPD